MDVGCGILILLFLVFAVIKAYASEIVQFFQIALIVIGIIFSLRLIVSFFTKDKKKNETGNEETEGKRRQSSIAQRWEEEENFYNWILEEADKSVSEQIQKAVQHMNDVSEGNRSYGSLPFELYQYPDERKEYLKNVEDELLKTYNRIIIPEFPFLRPCTSYGEMISCENFFASAGPKFWERWNEIGRHTDIGKKGELELFSKYHFSPDEISNLWWKYTAPHKQKIYELFSQTHGNPIKIEEQIFRLGDLGEKRLQTELKMYSDIWASLFNVRLEVDGSSVESDAIVVSKNGVFTIEAKNFAESGSYRIRITKDGQWQKILPKGRVKPMDDVVSQSNRHVAYKQRFLNQKIQEAGLTDQYIFIEPIIVIANDKVMIENESDNTIIRVSQIYNYINNFKPTLSDEMIQFITDLFRENSLPPKKHKYRDYVKEFERDLKNVIPVYKMALAGAQAHQKFVGILQTFEGNSMTGMEAESFSLDIPINYREEEIEPSAQ